ncbi:Pkinase domain containing protein, partial [Trichuris trichiura]
HEEVCISYKVIHAGWNNFSRTIRGSHILLSSSGYACLSGFRLAASFVNESQRLRSLHDFDSNFKTSLLWLAPEVLQQFPAGYDLKSDIYSVGITACEMANGFPPFADMTSLQMFMEKLRGVTPRLLDGKTLASKTFSAADLQPLRIISLKAMKGRKTLKLL